MSKYCRLALSAAALAAALAIAGGGSAETPPSPAEGWLITSKTSALHGGTSFTAVLHATSGVANSAGVESAPILVLRRRGHSGLDVMVGWPVFLGLQTVEAAYKLDDGPIVRSQWIASTDGMGLFYAADRKRLVGELAAAHRLVVQTTRYQKGPVEAVFELGEVTPPTDQTLKACT